MKKKILFTILFTFIFVSIGFTADWSGFRDLKWGSEPSKDMYLVENGKNIDNKFYRRKNEKLKIGQAEISTISYGYYQNQLYYICIDFKDQYNFINIKETYFGVYGQGLKHNRFLDEYIWITQDVNIFLEYSKIKNKGAVVYFYVPINEKVQADKKQKALQGKEDI
jgi:hypothetical protein